MKRMVIDTSNLLFRVVMMNSKLGGTPEEKAGLALHSSIQTVHKYFKTYKPDQLIFAFEGKNNWRKAYTASDECISGRGYKANRVRDASMEPIFECINTFKDIMHNYTSAVCAWHDEVEADDIIAGIVQQHSHDSEEIIIISGDRDFIQLLNHPGVTLVDPATGQHRHEPDVNWFIFEKCIRGDAGDNVGSAFPRVLTKRLQKAYTDPYEMIQLMNEEWTDKITGKKMQVGKLYQENSTLMILDQQPERIRKIIRETVSTALANPGKYDHFEFLKFLGKYNLNVIADNIHLYMDMFNINDRAWTDSLKGKLQETKTQADVDAHIEQLRNLLGA